MNTTRPADTSRNGTSHQVGCTNSRLRARAVPKSVTKVEAMMTFPSVVWVRPVSTSTAYTTAREVVESATPQICAACQLHPNR